MSKLTRNEFEALVHRANLPIAPQVVDELYEAWTLLEPMLADVRARDRNRDAEPAQIFRADAWVGSEIESDGES